MDTITKEERRKLKKEKKKQASLTKLDGGRPSILLSRNYNMKLKLKVRPGRSILLIAQDWEVLDTLDRVFSFYNDLTLALLDLDHRTCATYLCTC